MCRCNANFPPRVRHSSIRWPVRMLRVLPWLLTRDVRFFDGTSRLRLIDTADRGRCLEAVLSSTLSCQPAVRRVENEAVNINAGHRQGSHQKAEKTLERDSWSSWAKTVRWRDIPVVPHGSSLGKWPFFFSFHLPPRYPLRILKWYWDLLWFWCYLFICLTVCFSRYLIQAGVTPRFSSIVLRDTFLIVSAFRRWRGWCGIRGVSGCLGLLGIFGISSPRHRKHQKIWNSIKQNMNDIELDWTLNTSGYQSNCTSWKVMIHTIIHAITNSMWLWAAHMRLFRKLTIVCLVILDIHFAAFDPLVFCSPRRGVWCAQCHVFARAQSVFCVFATFLAQRLSQNPGLERRKSPKSPWSDDGTRSGGTCGTSKNLEHLFISGIWFISIHFYSLIFTPDPSVLDVSGLTSPKASRSLS